MSYRSVLRATTSDPKVEDSQYRCRINKHYYSGMYVTCELVTGIVGINVDGDSNRLPVHISFFYVISSFASP